MIISKQTYKEYLKSDAIALGLDISSFKFKLINTFFPNFIWLFQKTLRQLEYYNNCKNKGLNKLYFYYLKYKFRKICLQPHLHQ